MHWMYWRYFMWNFAGRQNDIQGFGNSVHGNWISGIAPLDNSRLGNQDLLPEYLKENKAHNSYFMLPLLLGLIGLAFHFMKDQKNAFVVLLLFVLTGIAIVVYLNQTPDQPRERDYAYAASFFAFTIWIGLGVTALFSLFKKIIKNSPISATLAFVICIPVPLRMASENWDDHDRSNRYVCHDFGRNYLETCAPNAILFTFGDNDTFSVWYAQEVEGIRPDVKVCCLPYLNSDWYINQMKSKYYEADPMPLSIQDDKYISSTRDVQYFTGQGKSNKYISLPALIKELTENTAVTYENESIYVYDNRNYYIKVDKDAVVASGTVAPEDIDKIDTLIKVKMNTGNILKNELVILDFINTNNWERPIYFTGSNSRSLCGLDNYLQNEGFAYRLVPIKSDKSARINTDVLYNNMINKYTWGNINNPNILIDYTIDRTTRVCRIRENFERLATELWKKGEKEKALKTLERCDSVLIPENFSLHYFDVSYASALYTVGKTEEGDKYLQEVIDVADEELLFFNSLPKNKKFSNSLQIRISFQSLISANEIADRFGRKELGETIKNKIELYAYQQFPEILLQ